MIHFNLDGSYSQCGINLSKAYVDQIDTITEVTCKQCCYKWNRLKNKWQKELEREERINRTVKRIEKRNKENQEYVKKWRKKHVDF